jgi:hypothetical protein
MQNAEQEFTPEELVPLALIALEADEPIEQVVDLLGADVVLDAVGMRAVSAEAARRFFAQRAEQAHRMAEQSRRLLEARTPIAAPAGIRRPENADPTMTAYEVMLAADADRPDPNRRVTPTEEFLAQRLGPPRDVVAEGEHEQ